MTQSPTPALSDTVSRIADELDIRLLAARFADAAIRGDARSFAALWAPDCEWEIAPPLPARASGTADVTSLFVRLRDGWGFFVQAAFNPIVRVSPGRERARARFTVEEIAKSVEGDRSYHNLAIYDDDLVRMGGSWFFKRRVYRYLWLSEDPIPGRAVAPRGLSLPVQDRFGGLADHSRGGPIGVRSTRVVNGDGRKPSFQGCQRGTNTPAPSIGVAG